MGWKKIKEHYRIDHIVCVTERGICIGSPYCHDLILVRKDLSVTRPHSSLAKGQPFDRIIAEMEANPAMLQRLIEEPDEFDTSIPVYTYKGGEVIEKRCEELGWPNITHDGELMYENTFSDDKDKVVAWAKRNAACAIENMQSSVRGVEERLAKVKGWLAEYEANLAKLNADYPEIPADA